MYSARLRFSSKTQLQYVVRFVNWTNIPKERAEHVVHTSENLNKTCRTFYLPSSNQK